MVYTDFRGDEILYYSTRFHTAARITISMCKSFTQIEKWFMNKNVKVTLPSFTDSR
jgi:hypothetical protein